MINTFKIKNRLSELGYSQKDAAVALNIKQPTFSQKINNIRPLYLSEAAKLIDFLKINIDDFSEYFFYDPSCVMQDE